MVATIRERLGSRRPKIAIVLGSGLGFLAERFTDAVSIPYSGIPGFPDTTVIGHGGALVCGQLLGGVIIQLDIAGLSWRPAMFVLVPVGLAALIACQICMSDSPRDSSARRTCC